MVVSAGAGAIMEVSVVVTVVESEVDSVLEEPLQAAKNAQIESAIRIFFILINLDFLNVFYVYTVIF